MHGRKVSQGTTHTHHLVTRTGKAAVRGSEAHLMVISYSVGSWVKSECMRLTACRKRRSWGAATRGRLAGRRRQRW